MAHIRPFSGIRYVPRPDLNVSDVIAPPYDVLDDAGKAALQQKHPNNVVTVDLPWMPPKTVGPDDAYEKSNVTLHAWLNAGILARDRRPAIYPYTQSFDYNGRTYHRRGFICLVQLEPFGAGHIVPHEKTYQGPIEDRLKLMKATGVQLSPIFGLFPDPRHDVTRLLYQNLAKPELSGTLDGVTHQLWSVIDSDVENAVMEFIAAKSIYIADGHHRYTTALEYQKQIREQNGGTLPPAHPANWCMFVLVGMQDDGLLILPTHRLIGGLDRFDPAAFQAAIGEYWTMSQTTVTPERINDYVSTVLASQPTHTFALYDAGTRRVHQLRLTNPDILSRLEPKRSQAWQRLDVAILQRYLLDEILQPTFAAGRELVKGYTANAAEIPTQVDGQKYQLALLLKSTPLGALEQLGRHNEVMPQKSTYFFPKLATGLVMYPLAD